MAKNQFPSPQSLEEGSTAQEFTEARYFRQSGLSLIQIMLIFLIVGVLGSMIANYFIDTHCASEPTSAVCNNK